MRVLEASPALMDRLRVAGPRGLSAAQVRAIGSRLHRAKGGDATLQPGNVIGLRVIQGTGRGEMVATPMADVSADGDRDEVGAFLLAGPRDRRGP